ncbi:MAG: hypothetical protein RR213_07445, partial [Raoultibacter sp.]
MERYYTTDDERLLIKRVDYTFSRFSYETLDWVSDGLIAGIFVGEILVDEITPVQAAVIMDRIR